MDINLLNLSKNIFKILNVNIKEMRMIMNIRIKKHITIILLCISCCMLVAGCKNQTDNLENQEEASIEVFAMDTYMTLKAYGEHGQEALEESKEEIERLDALWSVGNMESEIYQLNKDGKAKISKETIKLIQCAQKIWKETDGAFDLTIYPLMELWGFTTENYQVPDEKEIQEILDQSIGMDKITINETTREVILKDGAQIDLGGIAKGYTSSQVAKIFQDYGVEHGVVSLGGNVQAIGEKTDGSRWRVGIQPPSDDMDMIGTYEAYDEAVITSGGYERYFEQDGNIYHHILDPETGAPTKKDLVSVTIISEDGMMADCLSTTLFVMGREKAENYWKANVDKFDMILMDDNSNIYITEGIKDQFTSEYEYTVLKR